MLGREEKRQRGERDNWGRHMAGGQVKAGRPLWRWGLHRHVPALPSTWKVAGNARHVQKAQLLSWKDSIHPLSHPNLKSPEQAKAMNHRE